MYSHNAMRLIAMSLLSASAAAYWLPETLLNSSVTTCVVPKNTTGDDDSPSFTATVASCGSDSRIIFSGNETYNLLTPVSFSGLSNVEFVMNGNISLSPNVTYMESVTANSKLYPGHWITMKGTGVTITGSQDPRTGWFVGHGEQWWPMPNNTDNDYRPHFFSFSVTSLRLRDVKVYNPVAWVFSISGSDIYMTNTTLDARSSDPIGAFPFNTDGIDLSASDVVVDGWTSWNGDDVLNVTPPATNVTVRNIVAWGTHGVSVSCSSGTGGDYLFENAVIYDSLIGARFKGQLGTTCELYNVTWRNMAIFNTSYPIHFIENYVDQEVGVKSGTNTSLAAYATNFTWSNIVTETSEILADGSCITDPCWTYTAGESNQKGMYIMCEDAAHCQDFHFDNIVMFGADGKVGEMDCTGLEGIEGMGIPCTNGTLPTQL